MEKLEIKDGFLLDARYDFIREGFRRGTFALLVKLGDPEKFNAENVTELVLGAHRRKWPPRRIVCLHGNVALAHPRVTSLLAAFAERGFETQIETTDDMTEVPRPLVMWATLRTSKSGVLHAFNEIVYAPSREDIEAGKLKSFSFPLAPTHGVVSLWLNVAAGAASLADVERFLVDSPWPWQVAL